MKRFAMVVLLCMITTFLVYSAESTEPNQTPLVIGITAILSVAAVILGGKFKDILSLLGIRSPSEADVNHLVDTVLAKIGVPALFADLVGDVVATIYSKLGATRTANSTYVPRVRNEVIRRITSLPTKEAQDIIQLPSRVVRSQPALKQAIRLLVNKTSVVEDSFRKLELEGFKDGSLESNTARAAGENQNKGGI